MSNQLMKRDPLDISIPGFTFRATGVEISGAPKFETWQVAMQFAKRCESGVQFWIGDLLRFGYASYGELASQEDGDGDEKYAYQTLADAKYVADKIPLSVRTEKVSFTHHKLVAPLDPPEQKKWLDKAVAERLTVSELRKEIRAAKLAETAKANPLPSDKYRVIYADPPWSYNDERMGTISGGGAGAQYDTLSTDEICNLPVGPLALPNSVLFLWATSPLLPDALRVIEAWGFSYKASFMWDKLRGFNGHYNDVRHELLLVAVRGSCTPDLDSLYPSVIAEEKSRHSAKPESFRDMIADMYPSGPRIELFARRLSNGWDVWGNEVSAAA